MATYHELVIKGDDRDLVPFVAGFIADSGATGVFIASESGFHIRALRERIKHHGETHHVICEEKTLPKLRKVLETASQFSFEIVDEVEILRACFRFEFKTPSREVAAKLKKILDKLPAGVSAVDYDAKEVVDPDAAGAEVYSPAHEYEFRGKGQIEGDVGGVVAAHEALRDIEFARVEEIELRHA